MGAIVGFSQHHKSVRLDFSSDLRIASCFLVKSWEGKWLPMTFLSKSNLNISRWVDKKEGSLKFHEGNSSILVYKKERPVILFPPIP